MESIEIVFENCESMIIPDRNIVDFSLKEYKGSDCWEMNLHIKGLNGIDYYDFGQNRYSPIERLQKYKDIVSVNVNDSVDGNFTYEMVWTDYYSDENMYQINDRTSWNEIIIKISVSNHKKYIKNKHEELFIDILSDYQQLENRCEDCYNNKICDMDNNLCDFIKKVINKG